MNCGRMFCLLCAMLIAWGCVPQATVTSPEARKKLELHYQSGIKYLAEGKTPQAIKEFMEAQAAAPNNSDVEHALGLAYQQKGLNDQAIFQYKKAITLEPKLTEARNNMGTAFLSKGMFTEAMAEFEQCLKDPTYGTPEKAAYNMGFANLKQRNIDKAIEYYGKAITMQPENPNALYYLGLCYLEKDNPSAALENFNKVVAIDPTFQDTFFHIGTLYEKLGQQAKAMVAFKRVCEQDSTNLAARLGLGRVLVRLGHTEEGLRSLELVSKADEGNLAKEAKEEMGRASATNKFKGIPKVNVPATSSKGSPEDTEFRKGMLHEKQGQLAKAVAAYKEICEQDPANLAALLRLGMVQVRLGHTGEGLKNLETVAKADEGGNLAKQAGEVIERAKAGGKFKGIPKVSAP